MDIIEKNDDTFAELKYIFVHLKFVTTIKYADYKMIIMQNKGFSLIRQTKPYYPRHRYEQKRKSGRLDINWYFITLHEAQTFKK